MKNLHTHLAKNIFALFVVISLFFASTAAAENLIAGNFIFVHGEVWVVKTSNTQQPAEKGARIYETDTIITSKKGTAQLIMSDGAYLSIKPDTTLKIEVYKYKSDENGTEKSIISLIKGCFRSVTGLIGRKNKDNYKVKTPLATIGIRGTDHEPLYIPEPEDGEISFAEPGVYDKVNSGETYIQNEAGTVTVLPNQVGYAPDADTLPTILERTPEYFKTATPSSSDDETSDEKNDVSAEQSEEAMAALNNTDLFENILEESLTFSVGSGYHPVEQEIIALDENNNPYNMSNLASIEMPTTQQPEDLTPEDPTPEDPTPVDPIVLLSGYFSWADNTTFNGIISMNADDTEMQTDVDGNLEGCQYDAHPSPNPNWTETVRLVNPTSPTYQEANHFSETGIRFGTWQADSIERVSYGGTVESSLLGNGLAHWIMGTELSPYHLSQALTGTLSFSLDGATSPTNQDGVAGVLNSASLSVDFTRQTVDTALDLTVNTHDWVASATDIPLDRAQFSASTLLSIQVDGSPSASSWGNLSGSLSGEGLNGGILSYTLGDTTLGETVTGVASFYSSTPQDVNTNYRKVGISLTNAEFPMPSTVATHYSNAQSRISTDGSGNITGLDAVIPQGSPVSTNLPVHFDMGSASLVDTGTDAGTGISWGRWSGGTIDATDRANGFPLAGSTALSDLHYVAGPEMTSPCTLPISGTFAYSLVGGTNPTDNLGNVGTLNSAALTANFSDMTVSTGINATVNNVTFDANAAAIPIDQGSNFGATHNDALTVTCSGTGAGTTHTGTLSGAFHGTTGQGAGIVYSFNTTDGGPVDTTVSGAAAFGRQ